MPPKRRHLSGREIGSGAGAPRSMQDQFDRNEASRRHAEKIIRPAVEQFLAEREQTRAALRNASNELVDMTVLTPWDRLRKQNGEQDA